MKLLICLDTNEHGEDVFLGASLIDDGGNPIGADLEVRDYGRGDTPDDSGALYELLDA